MQATDPNPGISPEQVAGVVRRRAAEVGQAVEALAASEHSEPFGERVHRLRVCSRKCLVALDLCPDMRRDRAWRRLRRHVRALRRAVGVVRDCDVHAAILRAVQTRVGATALQGLADALSLIEHDRRLALAGLSEAVEAHRATLIRRAARRLRESLRCEYSHDQSVGERALPAARSASTRLEEAAVADLSVPANLHELRLAVKAVRYEAEVRAVSTQRVRASLDRSLLARAQARLGDVNDIATLVDRLAGYVRSMETLHTTEVLPETRRQCGAIDSLRARFSAVLDSRCIAAADWWRKMTRDRAPGVSLAVYLAAAPDHPDEQGANQETHVLPQLITEAAPAHHTNGRSSPALAPEALIPPQACLWIAGLVIGVIDVGSNSIRLLVVEMIDERSWRVVGEERAMTRLAHGLAEDGRLSTDAMARSVEAVGRFKLAAQHLGASTVRAFATAAVREAANGADFRSLVRDRTGLTLEIVSAAEEGSLTYRSVARVQDLARGTAAVVDMGGGSMEVVFSDEGVITGNTSMSLGALRITEQFGGAEACASHRYKEMRSFAQRTIRRRVPKPESPPAILAGCGGTFTTILTLAAASRGVLLERNSPALSTLGPVSREQVRELIAQLRSMTLEERLRVPGLPSDRADIVIAGLVVVERLMRHLGCTQLFVHPGGVREGLVMRIVDEYLAKRLSDSGAAPDVRLVDESRAFAVRCRYEKAHSEHVLALALSLYDQFLQGSDMLHGLGTEPQERALLAAAAILHDVGVMVAYRGHHRHSATIIRYAGFTSCTPQQLEIIAQIARYHRKRTPSMKHAEFAALAKHEREVVKRLAAILRIADGLDRARAQRVTRARLRFAQEGVRIEIEGTAAGLAAGFDEEIAASLKKSDLMDELIGAPITFHIAGAVASQTE